MSKQTTPTSIYTDILSEVKKEAEKAAKQQRYRLKGVLSVVSGLVFASLLGVIAYTYTTDSGIGYRALLFMATVAFAFFFAISTTLVYAAHRHIYHVKQQIVIDSLLQLLHPTLTYDANKASNHEVIKKTKRINNIYSMLTRKKTEDLIKGRIGNIVLELSEISINGNYRTERSHPGIGESYIYAVQQTLNVFDGILLYMATPYSEEILRLAFFSSAMQEHIEELKRFWKVTPSITILESGECLIDLNKPKVKFLHFQNSESVNMVSSFATQLEILLKTVEILDKKGRELLIKNSN